MTHPFESETQHLGLSSDATGDTQSRSVPVTWINLRVSSIPLNTLHRMALGRQ